MDVGAFLIGAAVLALCVPYVANPFLRKRTVEKRWGPVKKTDLKTERQSVLAALRELEFDFQTGKVVEEDYVALRAQLLLEAASLLPENEPQEDELEALIQARREKLAEDYPCRSCGSRLTPGDQFCPDCGSPVRHECPACGKDLIEGAKFCSHCGTAVEHTKQETV